MVEKTVLSLPPEKGPVLRTFVDEDLTCGVRGEPMVLQRQRRRSNLVLLLGLDVPAIGHVVKPTGEVLHPEVICERMRQLTRLPPKALTREEEKALEIAKSIINTMSQLRSSPAHLLDLLGGPVSATASMTQVAAAISLGLQLGTGNVALMSPLKAAITGLLAAAGPLRSLLLGNPLQGQAPEGGAHRPDEAASALEAALRDLRFSNGLTPEDLKDREQLRQRLRDIDIEVFKLQGKSPEDLLTQVKHTEYPMEAWQRLAAVMSSALKQHPSSFDVLSTQKFRELVLQSPDHVLYTASMVFDSEGRLRTNADGVRAFYVVWLGVARNYGKALLATGALHGLQPPDRIKQPEPSDGLPEKVAGVLGGARRALQSTYQTARGVRRRRSPERSSSRTGRGRSLERRLSRSGSPAVRSSSSRFLSAESQSHR
jgi:hypothetical protein